MEVLDAVLEFRWAGVDCNGDVVIMTAGVATSSSAGAGEGGRRDGGGVGVVLDGVEDWQAVAGREGGVVGIAAMGGGGCGAEFDGSGVEGEGVDEAE